MCITGLQYYGLCHKETKSASFLSLNNNINKPVGGKKTVRELFVSLYF